MFEEADCGQEGCDAGKVAARSLLAIDLVQLIAFFDAVLPSQGWRCMWAKKDKRILQSFYQTNLELAGQIRRCDAEGWDAYYCTATLKEAGNRKAENAFALKSFRLDADVKAAAYPSKRDAAKAVLTMLLTLGLHATIVESGYGLHVYLVLGLSLPPEEWLVAAHVLDQLAKRAGLLLDHGVTTDVVRVLRAPGTSNHKEPSAPRPVRLLGNLLVNVTEKVIKVLSGPVPATALVGLQPNARAVLGMLQGPYPPSSASLVADRCGQLAKMRETKRGNGIWYFLLGILAFCADGETTAQDWSANHNGYSPEETSQKLIRWRAEDKGPVTCRKLEELNPAPCASCPSRGTITSPVQLGREGVGSLSSPPALGDTGTAGEGLEPFKPLPVRELVIDAVMSVGAIFWRDPDSYAFVTLPHGATLRRYRVRSRAFSLEVRRIYGYAHPTLGAGGARPGSITESTLAEVLSAFEAIAFCGDMQEPVIRTFGNTAEIIIDFGCANWRAARVTAEGWTIIERTNAPLIRPDGMRALPEPTRDTAALEKLRELLNLPRGGDGDADFRLIVVWLVSCLWPVGPYCVLALDGEQGSGKSTACRMLRRLVDPSRSDLRAPPRSEDDLLIAAVNGRVIALDNVSYIDSDTADAICRLSTGAGFGKRKLYADLDEVSISVARPVLLNGIPSLLARGDLADRAIAVTLSSIPDDQRRPEADVWRDFEAAAPSVLGMLLDGLVAALTGLPTLRLPQSPRMSDFAHLAVAAAPAFGWTGRQMMDALDANRRSSIEAVIESDPVAGALQALASKGVFEGTATQLLAALNQFGPPDPSRDRSWPKNPNALGQKIKRLNTALRRVGIEINSKRVGPSGERVLRVTMTGS